MLLNYHKLHMLARKASHNRTKHMCVARTTEITRFCGQFCRFMDMNFKCPAFWNIFIAIMLAILKYRIIDSKMRYKCNLPSFISSNCTSFAAEKVKFCVHVNFKQNFVLFQTLMRFPESCACNFHSLCLCHHMTITWWLSQLNTFYYDFVLVNWIFDQLTLVVSHLCMSIYTAVHRVAGFRACLNAKHFGISTSTYNCGYIKVDKAAIECRLRSTSRDAHGN